MKVRDSLGGGARHDHNNESTGVRQLEFRYSASGGFDSCDATPDAVTIGAIGTHSGNSGRSFAALARGVVEYGRRPESVRRRVEEAEMVPLRVLFVCTANISRSAYLGVANTAMQQS